MNSATVYDELDTKACSALPLAMPSLRVGLGVDQSRAMVSEGGPTPASCCCPGCSRARASCTCTICYVCAGNAPSIKKLETSPIQKHCPSCGYVRCEKCIRKRYNRQAGFFNPCASVEEPLPVCAMCAVRSGLFFLRSFVQFDLPGLMLLCENADHSNRCVDPTCGALTYGRKCRACSLPVVHMAIPYCEYFVMDADAESPSVASIESVLRAKRKKQFQELTFQHRNLEDAVPVGLIPPLLPQPSVNLRIFLATICSTVVYEYRSGGYSALEAMPFLCGSVLFPREFGREYSIFDAPGKVRFVAFPGTHDLRTFHTNIQTTQVRIMKDPADEVIQNVEERLLRPGYNVHKGFYQVVRSTPIVELALEWVEEGYELIFCGHSQGGAIAQIAMICLMQKALMRVRESLLCVTFGSPCVGNHELLKTIEEWEVITRFHHFVNGIDIIPRVLHGATVVKRTLDNLVGAACSIWKRLGKSEIKGSGELIQAVSHEYNKAKNQGTDQKGLEAARYVCTGIYHFMNLPSVSQSLLTTANSLHAHNLLCAEGLTPTTNSIEDHLMRSYFKSLVHIALNRQR